MGFVRQDIFIDLD